MNKKVLTYSVLILGLAIFYFVFQNTGEGQAYTSTGQDGKITLDSTKNERRYEPKLLYGVNVDSLNVYEGIIQRNQNLASILSDFNVAASKIAEIGHLPSEVFDVRKLQYKKPFTIIYDNDTLKTARYFVYQPNPIDYVMIDLQDSIRAAAGKNEVDTILTELSGVIEYSLYQTVVDSGASPLLVNNLADVYAWEIDFFGLKKGDLFKVYYERYEVNGEEAGIGQIVSAWFNHMGEDFYAIQYDQGEGMEYFDEEGQSLRKTFLKAPLKFSRISSHFSYSRLHPILKIRRPHLGVDYAAPKGTPVVAVGDGLVTRASYGGGGGNTVKIKHNSNYETAYLHLSKYGPGIKQGVRVKQGDVIGYVGSTGLSTGPHLDFRFYKNGKPVDPLKIDPPSANPIKEEEMENYLKVKDLWINKLDSIKITPAKEAV